jgi:hypothetical protein
MVRWQMGSDGMSGCKGTKQWEIATGAVACMHDAWLQRGRLVDKVGSKRVQWVLALDVGLWLQVYVEAQLVVRCKQLVAN